MMPEFGRKSARDHALEAVALGARTFTEVRRHARKSGCSVSSQAVWKAVQRLVGDGVLACVIEEGRQRYELSEGYLRRLGRIVNTPRCEHACLHRRVDAEGGDGIVRVPEALVGREVLVLVRENGEGQPSPHAHGHVAVMNSER